MQNQKALEKLGYSANEAKVYLTALRLGEANISYIAERAEMPPSTVQVIVERLHEDGLMNFYIMRRNKYWIAEKPQRLLDMIKEREEVIAEAVPKLDAIRGASRTKDKRDEQYKKSLSVFEEFSEASPLPILITNSDVEIEYINDAWQKKYGYTLEEIQGENPRIFKSGQTPQKVYEVMWKALRRDELFQSDEVIDRQKDGTYLNLLTTIFPVRHGNRKFYIQILSNLTDKKSFQELHKSFADSETNKDTEK